MAIGGVVMPKPCFSQLKVRVSTEERRLLKLAADRAQTSLSGSMRWKAVEAAEIDLLDRRVVSIPAENWEHFETWARLPGKDVAALRDLASRKPVWQEN